MVRVKGCVFGLSAGLCSCARFAGLNIGLDVLVNLGPPVVMENEFLSLFHAWVADCNMIVTARYNFPLYGKVSGDIDPLVIV